MDDKPILRYFSGEEADQFTFYRVPKQLFTNDYFRVLSTDAKVLYGLMLDRIGLSIKNKWIDEENHAFIYFSVEDIMRFLNCKKNKALQTIAELDNANGIGLIEKKRQGQGRPSIIYVKNFFIPEPEKKIFTENQFDSDPEVGNSNFKKLEKQTSRGLKNQLLEVGKNNPNDNDINNTNSINNKSYQIISRTDADRSGSMLSGYETYGQQIKQNIEYDFLLASFPMDQDIIEGIYELIVETVVSGEDPVHIAKNQYPAELVRSRFMKLNYSHIEYVLGCLHGNTTKVRNIKKYMLAVLFNAVTTVGSYYQQEANYDMCH